MTTLYLVFLLLSAVCFGMAAVGAALRNVNLVALGLLFFVLVPLVQTLRTF